MTLRKIWTSQYQRYGRAAYAESNDIYIDVIVAEIIAIMADPEARFYKVEIKENGAYVGYFIVVRSSIVKSYIRPHFTDLVAQFFSLADAVIDSEHFASSLSSDNIKS